MLKKFYKNVVFIYPKSILFLIFLLISFLGYQAFNLKVDASAETLLLEDDKDLAYTRVVNTRYRSPDFLVITYSPQSPLLSDETLLDIKELSDELLALPLVESVTSLRNIPLMQSPPRPVSELVEDVPTIEKGGIDLALAKTELLNNPLYSENLVSPDFKTTAIMINLFYDEKYYDLLDARNALRLKAQEKGSTQTVQREFANTQETFTLYRDSLRDTQHDNILKIREVMEAHQDKAEVFLGGVSMIADDMITYVKRDLQNYGLIVLLLLITVFWVAFRQIRWVVLPVFILAVSITASIGLLGFFGWEVTVISSNYVSDRKSVV